MVIKLDDAVLDKKQYFLPFCNALQLKEVILGARSSLLPNDIESNIPSIDEGVRILKSRLAFRSFKIVQNRSVKPVISG